MLLPAHAHEEKTKNPFDDILSMWKGKKKKKSSFVTVRTLHHQLPDPTTL